jgi:tRNA (mo5U34)-methyltransferase
MDLHLFANSLPSELRNWVTGLLPNIGSAMDPAKNGHISAWQAALDAIEAPSGTTPVLDRPIVWDGSDEPLDPDVWKAFHPWRKGPYRMGSVEIDTEWRSDWKWDRLLPALDPLKGRRCLDVGCGNGYHLWRMLGEGADLAVGLDPFLLYVYQFFAVHKRIPLPNISVLPLGAEAIRDDLNFDTVFSMGVLYHCKDPAAHLQLLGKALRPGGQLVLETLTVPDEFSPVLHPPGRYAQMRNVHALPTVDTLLDWVGDAGFTRMEHVDTTRTTFEEQRSTPWMTFHSLRDFLDPEDASRTIEGHPAPQRTLLSATH